MAELIIANKAELTDIADAVRSQTGDFRLLSLIDIKNEIRALSTIALNEPSENDIPKVFIDGVIPTTKTDVQAELTYISKTLSFHS